MYEGHERYEAERHERYEAEREIVDLLWDWLEARDKDRQLREFQDNEQPPESPEQFEDVGDLLEHNRKFEAYTERKSDFERRANEARSSYNQREKVSLRLFPTDVPLIYEHQSYGAGSATGRFKIVRVQRNTPELDIEELPAE